MEARPAIFALKNETLFTSIQPYIPDVIRTEAEHNQMHSSRLNSDIDYPHSALTTPVHEIPNNADSKMVGILVGIFAWDYALRFLLPNNVAGIMVELRNTCNQTSLYALSGHDAFYLGDNATKETTYDNMEVVRDLSVSTHPNFTTTPGHCRYSIVGKQCYYRTIFLHSQNFTCSLTIFFFLRVIAYISKFNLSQQLQHENTSNICKCCSVHLCIGRGSIFHL